MKTYTLTGRDGRPYTSPVPGAWGGHRRTKIYGRLDCPFLDFPPGAFWPGVALWHEVTGSRLSPLRGAAGEFATPLPGRCSPIRPDANTA